MSTPPPDYLTGPTGHLALRYLRGALDTPHPIDEPYVLNERESRTIHYVKVYTALWVVLVSIAGLGFLFWPLHNWPEFFAPTLLTLNGSTYELPLVLLLYGILLLYLEVNLLLLLNIKAVHTIMAVCQFPRQYDAQYDRHLYALAEAAQEKDSLGSMGLGFTPYLSLPGWGLSLFLLVNQLKALLSTVLTHLVVGQFILSPVASLAGFPLSAFWNTWASRAIIHEAQIRIMAPTTIRQFVDDLYEEWHQNDQFLQLIPEALQYIGVLERQYNYAHLLLSETLMDRFGLSVVRPISSFTEAATDAPARVRQGLERLIIFSALIDGKLSWFERRRLNQLRKRGWVTYPSKDIELMGRSYNQGKGLWI